MKQFNSDYMNGVVQCMFLTVTLMLTQLHDCPSKKPFLLITYTLKKKIFLFPIYTTRKKVKTNFYWHTGT